MHSDILGDDILGDEELGEDGEGVGEDLLGDYLIGEDLLGDELLGDADIMGNYLVGAAAAPRRKKVGGKSLKALAKRAALAKRLASAKLVRARPPTKSRVQSVGFTRAAVPPNTTAEITARPQVLFRGTRLIVGSTIAASFVIEDIKVGRNSQFVATGGQPAEAYRDTATGDNVSLDTCKPGVDITLIVTNITGVAVDFRATLFGDAIE